MDRIVEYVEYASETGKTVITILTLQLFKPLYKFFCRRCRWLLPMMMMMKTIFMRKSLVELTKSKLGTQLYTGSYNFLRDFVNMGIYSEFIRPYLLLTSPVFSFLRPLKKV